MGSSGRKFGTAPDAGCPDPTISRTGPTSLACEVAAANRRLVRLGAARRLAAPGNGDGERDRVSTELMLALKETGDRAFLEALWRLNAAMLSDYCRLRLRRRGVRCDPLELVDDAFLQAWLKCDRFQPGPRATFTGWILVISEHLVMQAARRQRREAERAANLPILSPPRESDALADPATRVEIEEIRQRLAADWSTLIAVCAAVLREIPEASQQALLMRERDGLSYDRIADELGLRRGGVAMRIRRARQQVLLGLRRCLESQETEFDEHET
jgi:RNA polymerase sigma factor (sigma-70 family)